MKNIFWILVLLVPAAVQGQMNSSSQKNSSGSSLGIGIKAGFNFSNVTNASEVNASSRTGYHFGLFLAPSSKSILSSRTELIYSRHGYNYADSSKSTSGSVNLDYIMLAQLMAINITKYVQIQLGGQTSYLLSAKADSSKPSTGNASADQALSYYNRIDYGYGVGVEIHPVAGFLIGARYNVSLANLYKQSYSFTPGSPPPSFIPNTSSINLKNNVLQLFLGYRF